jgi:integrase
LNYLIHLDKLGTRDAQIKNVNWILTHISQHAHLDNPKEVDEFISYHKGADSYKAHLTQVYYHYCKNQQIAYKPPKYNKTGKPIRIPTEEQLNMIIADSGKTLAMKLTLSKETGLRPVEVHTLKVKDIDLNQRLVYPTTAKHGAPRTLKIDNETASLILAHIIRNKLNPNDQLFKGQASSYNTSFTKVRNSLAKKLNDPTFKTIRLYDLRHYFATMLYHKTREIMIVKQQLGHKDINNTLIYIDMEATLYNLTDDYICKTAKTTDESIKLIETGFEYVTEQDGIKLYRKRK